MRQLVTGVMRLTWVTAGYGWFAIVAPILVAAPGFFGGDMTIGGLMVVVGAFTQVQQALRWFVDNFNTIADWLATLRRVASFRRALVEMDKLGHEVGRIEFAAGERRKGRVRQSVPRLARRQRRARRSLMSKSRAANAC